ncbi:TIR domain-containing protein [uncultured Litoreibacter sp.]|uniref:TIR domain-containing protein n=1 Tax=uncultured Litoreibacter sp. TaxID=1392394 RepID=UPI002631CEA2|nr:TIR domain-containing protein [uncultured Litoreibacter sp.]
MFNVFTSYHHHLDQDFKEDFVTWGTRCGLINDYSVNTGEIDETLPNETIRQTIRDYYLRDSEVTVLLCGKETRFRKHVDWELKSTMINGAKNKKSGILVIDLPTSDSFSWHTSYFGEKELIYPEKTTGWFSIDTEEDWKSRFPNLPRRIIENMRKWDVNISIVPWERVYGHPDRLKFLLSETAKSGKTNNYDTSRIMRTKNYNPKTDFFDQRT